MCGRMTLTRRDLDEVADELGAQPDDPVRVIYRPRFNVAPTDRHPIVVARDGRRLLGAAVWGMPSAGSGRPVVNARAETAAALPTFRDAFRRGRCVVPADGFYEWQDTPEGRAPLWFHRADGGLLLMAGLYVDAAVEGGFVRRFVVLTTGPNAVVRPVHDRMPALLSAAEADRWLAAPAPDVLHPAAEDLLVATPVSTRVNSVKHDDPGCLDPAPVGRGQLRLF